MIKNIDQNEINNVSGAIMTVCTCRHLKGEQHNKFFETIKECKEWCCPTRELAQYSFYIFGSKSSEWCAYPTFGTKE